MRKRVPDINKAASMLEAAQVDIRFLETLPVNQQSGQSIIRGIYENFRLLGEAYLAVQGLEPAGADHHKQVINALLKLNINAEKSVLVLDELRKLRHSINYDGYIPSLKEIEYVISIKKALWIPVFKEVKKMVR